MTPPENNQPGNGKTALICGISGQDGAYLARLLLSKGYRVAGTSRDAQMNGFGNLGTLGVLDRVELASMAVTDFRSVLDAIKRFRPHEIYNLAGQSSVGLSFDQPVETMESIGIGALNILEAVRISDSTARVYNASSGECFGDTGGISATEETPFRPRSPYAVAKAAAFWQFANYREAYGLFACSGILFNHESALRPERFVTQKIVKAACRIAQGKGERLRLGSLMISRDWGWAPEYVEAMWRMMQIAEPRDILVATGQTARLVDFVSAVFSEVGLDWRDHVDSDPGLSRPNELLVSSADPRLAQSVLEWRATVRMEEVAARMVAAELKLYAGAPSAGLA